MRDRAYDTDSYALEAGYRFHCAAHRTNLETELSTSEVSDRSYPQASRNGWTADARAIYTVYMMTIESFRTRGKFGESSTLRDFMLSYIKPHNAWYSQETAPSCSTVFQRGPPIQTLRFGPVTRGFVSRPIALFPTRTQPYRAQTSSVGLPNLVQSPVSKHLKLNHQSRLRYV